MAAPSLSYVCYGLIAREVERVDSGYRSAMSVQSALVMYPIYAYGTDGTTPKSTCQNWSGGEWIGCFGLTEPEPRQRSGRECRHARHQSRRRLDRCTAAKCGSPTRRSPMSSSSGRKPTAAPMRATALIRGFILERGMKGLSAPPIEGKFSLRASSTGEIVMDDVFVPDENLLPNARAA